MRMSNRAGLWQVVVLVLVEVVVDQVAGPGLVSMMNMILVPNHMLDQPIVMVMDRMLMQMMNWMLQWVAVMMFVLVLALAVVVIMALVHQFTVFVPVGANYVPAVPT